VKRRLVSDTSADVAVVGGGVVGCSVAYHLSRLGVRVILLERGSLGSQSTGRCAGGVRRQFSYRRNTEIQQISVRLLERFPDEIGVDPSFRRIGYLFVLTDDRDVRSFRERLKMWQECGVADTRWVSAEEIGELTPLISTDGVLGGTFCPSDGIASPSAITMGYAAKARSMGARILEGVEVQGIDLFSGRVDRVLTTAGPFAVGAVFDCAGAWAAAIGQLVGLSLPVLPYPRHVFVTEPLPDLPLAHPMVIDFSTSLYFHPEGPGLLFGMGRRGETPSFSTEVDWSFLDEIGRVASRRVPRLIDVGIRTGWVGLYESTPDHQPILGPVESVDGFWCACGFSGHGFQQAPAVGLLLAQQFVGEQPEIDLSDFCAERFAGGAQIPERNVV
jgi:sarcosine oxidase subunit beta